MEEIEENVEENFQKKGKRERAISENQTPKTSLVVSSSISNSSSGTILDGKIDTSIFLDTSFGRVYFPSRIDI